MILQNLIIQLKKLSRQANNVLLYASNRKDKQVYVKELKSFYKLTSEELDTCLIELASINIIDKEDTLLIVPLVKRIEKDNDILTIDINKYLLTLLQDHNSNMRDFIDMKKQDKNTCLLFALLVENDALLNNGGLTLSLISLKDKLQVTGKYTVLKDLQKNLISKPIRMINTKFNQDIYKYEYQYNSLSQITGVIFKRQG